MTLGMNGIMEGLTLGLTKGLTCSSCASYAPQVLQDVVHKDVLGIPADLFLWLGVAALASVVLAFTTYGRQVYAIGNNPTAAFLAGMNVRLVTVASTCSADCSPRSAASSSSPTGGSRRSEWATRTSSSRSPQR